MATAMRERHEIPVEHTWDLASIFENDEAWEAEIKTCEGIISRLPDYEGTLGSSAERLLEWLKISEELELKLGRVLAYAMLGYAVNTKDPSAGTLFQGNGSCRVLVSRDPGDREGQAR